MLVDFIRRRRSAIFSLLFALLITACSLGPPSSVTSEPTTQSATTESADIEDIKVEVICVDPFDFDNAEAIPDAFAWVDLDLDGLHGEDEPPLSGACILWFSKPVDINLIKDECQQKERTDLFTDSNGYWYSHLGDGGVIAGCFTKEEMRKEEEQMLKEEEQKCNLLYYALPPDGYILTTDSPISGCSVEFGFVKDPLVSPTQVKATPTN
jgi:hypothetical protein